ncbi:hypothetical protein OUZ56_000688 [Daphnia magna]|uniref:Uncharacterized protein n=1 Tax=Daphnia magna TaxID=35525 RepID=A0ABR0A0G7_9CRUS|nr:hypothetical protein OUZ56_000688 [Daphnia magna]
MSHSGERIHVCSSSIMYNVTLARLPRKQVPRDPLATGSLRDVARLRFYFKEDEKERVSGNESFTCFEGCHMTRA